MILRHKENWVWRWQWEGETFLKPWNCIKDSNILIVLETRSDWYVEISVVPAVLYTSEDICHRMEQYLPSLIKTGPYFLLVSCDSTVCSLWKISGGRKGESSPPPSDNTLRWPVFVGLVALRPASTGVSDGGTVTAEVKQRQKGGDWLKGQNHVAIHYLVLICDPWGRLQVSDWMVC